LKRHYPEISVLFSLVSIAISLLINYQIAKTYLRSDGKTKALFGLRETLQFGYQYYIALLGILALVLAIAGIRQNNLKRKKFTAVIFSLLAITIVFVRIWRLFV
jgi:hypothetical protein